MGFGLTSRRAFLGAAGGAGAATVSGWPALAAADETPPPLARPAVAPELAARDEAYWARVAAHYQVSRRFTNLEAGYWGMMAAPVLAEFQRHTERVNLESSFYARRSAGADLDAVRTRVAAALGARVDEIALTRGATESLQLLIAGYNRLRPGDVVMYADLDYPAMQDAMDWLQERRGARLARLTIPEPASRENVLAAYEQALEAHPGLRLLLLTHVNNKTGLVAPVREIVAAARRRGADVIVDAAHGFGQLDVTIADLGADFVGFNLHKWIGAPIGVGVMYVREGRLPDLDRAFADRSMPADSILSRAHTGTTSFATLLTVPAALDFHAAVGPAHKAARLRFLRDRWVGRVRGRPGIDVLTPDEPGSVGAITSLRLRGGTTKAANQQLVDTLLSRYGLFSTWRTGLDRGDCVRITPALYNTPADADRLAAALLELAAG